MTQEYRIDGSLLTNRIRLTAGGLVGGVVGLPSSAWYGEPMTAGVIIDDETGDLDLIGWHTFTADETACTTRPRIFSGWITGRRISRGPYKHGVARIWDCDIIDQNALFSFEVFRASSAKRPEETDIVRAAWCLASAPMAGTPCHDNGRANFTDNPTNFGDADYVTQYPVELFTSIAGTSGKNFYAYWDDDAEEISFHYDLIGSNPLSSLAISNDIADSDATTFYPFLDGQLSRTPENVYTGILFGYRGAFVYGRDEDTIDALSPTEFSPVNFLRDLVYNTDRVGKQATAEALVEQMLVAHSLEQDTITCKVRLPAFQINLLHAGDSVNVKFTHLAGYETDTQVDVVRRNVIPSPGRSDMYDVTLELTNSVSATRGPGGGGGDDFPPPPTTGHWWEGTFTIGGDSYEYSGVLRDDFQPSSDYLYNIQVIEQAGVGTYGTSVGPQTDLLDVGLNSPDLHITAGPGGTDFVVETSAPGGDTTVFSGTITTHSSVDPLDVFDMRGTTADDDHSGTHVTIVSFWMDPVGDPDFEIPPPAAGQPINNEVPSPITDGTTTVFTTLWPYADGSLRVYVDNLNQTAAVTESDPAAGEFTLAFAPTSTERITVWYQAR